MKRVLAVIMACLLGGGLCCTAGCGESGASSSEEEFAASSSSEPSEPGFSVPSEPIEPTEPSAPIEPTEPAEPTDPIEPTEPAEPSAPSVPANPAEPTNPAEQTGGEFALLDAVDLRAAFGVDESADRSFALRIASDAAASYAFKWTSEVSGREKFYAALGADILLADVLGLREDENCALGFDLFGGGTVGLGLTYTLPKSSSKPAEKRFEAGFYHDGDLILYADSGKEALALSGLRPLAEQMCLGMFKRLADAAEVIPDAARRGLGLRFGVEKLIDLGFEAFIEEGDGLTLHVEATEGVFTDLLNDMHETFLPADWLPYIPRADFRYRETAFSITLAFDADGKFVSYRVESDLDLSLALKVRGLFLCESTIFTSGGFEVSSHPAHVPVPTL